MQVADEDMDRHTKAGKGAELKSDMNPRLKVERSGYVLVRGDRPW